jgi:hypothetical protein
VHEAAHVRKGSMPWVANSEGPPLIMEYLVGGVTSPQAWTEHLRAWGTSKQNKVMVAGHLSHD